MEHVCDKPNCVPSVQQILLSLERHRSKSLFAHAEQQYGWKDCVRSCCSRGDCDYWQIRSRLLVLEGCISFDCLHFYQESKGIEVEVEVRCFFAAPTITGEHNRSVCGAGWVRPCVPDRFLCLLSPNTVVARVDIVDVVPADPDAARDAGMSQ